jgi:hypothetical protein
MEILEREEVYSSGFKWEEIFNLSKTSVNSLLLTQALIPWVLCFFPVVNLREFSHSPPGGGEDMNKRSRTSIFLARLHGLDMKILAFASRNSMVGNAGSVASSRG